MNDEKRRYLMVDANEMIKVLWKFERVAAFNDFYNQYYSDDKISFDYYFEKNNIPEEFRKIIFSLGYADFHAEEFNTGFKCKLVRKRITRKNNKIYINGIDYPLGGDEDFLEGTFRFSTSFKLYKYNDIMNFYRDLKDADYLELYLQTIKEAFKIERERIYVTHYGDKETIVR